MNKYEVIYDRIIAEVRIVKVKLHGFTMCITYSPKTDTDVHVKVEQADLFGPSLDYVKGEFVMTYNYMVIPKAFQGDFEAGYEKAKEFCQTAGDILNELTERMKKGEDL